VIKWVISLILLFLIQSCNWDTHTIEYSKEAENKIFSNMPNTKFAIMPMNFRIEVDGIEAYTGIILSVFSSYWPNKPVIHWPILSPSLIVIEPGINKSQDARDNQKVRNILSELNLLNK